MVLADGAPLSSKQEKRRAKATAKAARRLRRNPSAATVDEVCAWLGTIELGGCAAAFLKHEVDGETLLELTEAQLRDDLGLTRMGDRAKIRRERDRLVEETAARQGKAPPPPPEDEDAPGGGEAGAKPGAGKGATAAQARRARTGLRGTAPPPPPDTPPPARVKVSARWGNGGDWIHVKMDADEINLVSHSRRVAAFLCSGTEQVGGG